MDLDEEEDGLGGDDLTGRAMGAVLASAYKAANLADRVVKFDINGTERQFVHHVKSDGRRPKWIFFKLKPSLSPRCMDSRTMRPFITRTQNVDGLEIAN